MPVVLLYILSPLAGVSASLCAVVRLFNLTHGVSVPVNDNNPSTVKAQSTVWSPTKVLATFLLGN